MKRYFHDHPLVVWLGLFVVVAGVVFVLVWFQPQKLFIEKTVDEALPTVEPISGPTYACTYPRSRSRMTVGFAVAGLS